MYIKSILPENTFDALYDRVEKYNIPYIPFRLLEQEVRESTQDILEGKSHKKSTVEEQKEFSKDIEEFNTFPEGIFLNKVHLQYTNNTDTPSSSIESALATLELYDERGVTPPWWVSYNVAKAYIQNGDYSSAIGYLEDIQTEGLDPQYLQNIFLGKTFVYFQLGRYIECIEIAQQGLKIEDILEARKFDFHLDIVSSYLRLGNYPLSLKHIEEALKFHEQMNEETSIILTVRLLLCKGHKVGNQKIIDYCSQKRARLDPDVIYEVGAMYDALGNKEEAIKWFEKTIVATSSSIEAKKNAQKWLMNLYGKNNSLDKLVLLSEQALVNVLLNDRAIATLEGNIGVMYARLGNYQEAISRMLQCVEYLKVASLQDENLTQEEKTEFYKNIREESVGAYFYIALIYLELKDHNKALEYANKALDMDTNTIYTGAIYKLLEKIYKRLGEQST